MAPYFSFLNGKGNPLLFTYIIICCKYLPGSGITASQQLLVTVDSFSLPLPKAGCSQGCFWSGKNTQFLWLGNDQKISLMEGWRKIPPICQQIVLIFIYYNKNLYYRNHPFSSQLLIAAVIHKWALPWEISSCNFMVLPTRRDLSKTLIFHCKHRTVSRTCMTNKTLCKEYREKLCAILLII